MQVSNLEYCLVQPEEQIILAAIFFVKVAIFARQTANGT